MKNASDLLYQFEIPIDFMMGVHDLHTPYGPEKEYLETLNAPKKQISAVTKFVIPCTEAFQTLFGHLGQWGIGNNK